MNYKIVLILIFILTLIVWVGSLNTGTNFSRLITRDNRNANPHTFNDRSFADCEDYAVLISASKLARKLNVSKDWILTNYLIPIFADTLKNDKHVIGHAPPSGHCFIVEQDESWFFIQAPATNELGWVHRDFIVGFVMKDPITLLPCPGRM